MNSSEILLKLLESKKTILIIDDEEDIVDMVGMTIESDCNVNVISAVDSTQADRLIDKADLVILDGHFPGSTPEYLKSVADRKPTIFYSGSRHTANGNFIASVDKLDFHHLTKLINDKFK